MTIQSNQILQRGPDGQAHITLDTGEAIALPAGGPYEVGNAHNVLVGDLWILAGQSNMEGVGDLIDTEAPAPFVHTFQSREEWAVAEEPLHRLEESPRLAHHKIWGRDTVPEAPPPRSRDLIKGAGLGMTFGRERHARTGVPIGLIPCAHGGTSMAQWSPSLEPGGSVTLYGATIERVRENGGKVAGVLWYQGESDANSDALAVYPERMTALLQAFRDDLGQPELPFYMVQIGRLVQEPDREAIDCWNGIREAQRAWAQVQTNVLIVTAIDLDLDDAIHIGTAGLKRLGRRLADAAEGISAPELREAATINNGLRVQVSFDHVRGGLRAAGRPEGFSLRRADGREWTGIYKTTLMGDIATLHLTEPLPRGISLWYGWGLNPYCNITDEADGAVPAFGPISIFTGLIEG